jgi:hypothetical protein
MKPRENKQVSPITDFLVVAMVAGLVFLGVGVRRFVTIKREINRQPD